MILNCSLLLTQNDKQFVKRLRNLRTADRWQLSSIKNHFEKLLSALLKSIYLNHHIITNYPYCRQVLLFSQINLIKTTLWKQLKQFGRSPVYQNQWIIPQHCLQRTCPKIVDSAKASERRPKQKQIKDIELRAVWQLC